MVLLPSLTTRVVSERLVLRPARSSDVGELRAALRKNAEHLRPWEAAPEGSFDPTSLTAVANKVAHQRRDWRRGTSFTLLVTRRDATGGARERASEPVIGHVRLGGVLRAVFQNAYLGYWIDRDYQGQGLMTEAVRGALAFAFEVAELHRVQVAIMPRNAPSLRVAAKVGFRREGFAERYLRIAGVWEDHEIFAMTAEEWAARAEGPAGG